ncbi:MAG: ComEC/Rec2 family competence protein, partial [Mediterranea sp.]|nr:ComEC/Rec2 family competence protein [Mediterranea sp.]
GDNLSVLSALTVGEKEELSDEIRETYSATGVSHVLAISGLHVGLLYALLLLLFSWSWRRWRYARHVSIFPITLLLGCFAFLTGFSPSAVRSVIMFSLLCMAAVQTGTLLTLNSISATAFLMLCFYPPWLFDAGFQLSFAAVTAICFIQPRLYRLWSFTHKAARYVWGLTTVSVAAQIGTAPLVIFYFHRFSVHFLLSNLWIIPLITLLLYVALLLPVCTPFPLLQQSVAQGIDGLLTFQHRLLRLLEHLPGSSVTGLHTDVFEIALYYLFVLLVIRALSIKRVRSFYPPLLCLFVFACYYALYDAG